MRIALFLIICFTTATASAGDYADGPVSYELDLSQPYSKYSLSRNDKEWGESLVRNLKYKGKIIYFEQTTLLLLADGKSINGAVYQAKEKPNYYYVSNGDAMLKIGTQLPYSPGVGGFSMHTNKSRKFIACLNCLSGGVPFSNWWSFLSWSKIGKNKVSWNSHEGTRFDY